MDSSDTNKRGIDTPTFETTRSTNSNLAERKSDYIPGKTSLYSLSRDELILLLQNIQEDTAKYIEKKKRKLKENKKEIDELMFQVRNCNCEYSLCICQYPNCSAKALKFGKYDDVFEDCKKMYQCYDEQHHFCDQHIFCKKCKECEECVDHEECDLCETLTCPNDTNIFSPPDIRQDKPGTCECGLDLTQVTIYMCRSCRERKHLSKYEYNSSKMYHKCEKCKVLGVNYTHTFYKCFRCEHNNEKLVNQCSNCDTKRHFGCTGFIKCKSCLDRICIKCATKCKKCNIKQICQICVNEHHYCEDCSSENSIGSDCDCEVVNRDCDVVRDLTIFDPREERARLIPVAPLSWSSEAVECHKKLRDSLIEKLSWNVVMEILLEGCKITCNKNINILLICSWLQMRNIIMSLNYYITNQVDWESLFVEIEKSVSSFKHSDINIVNLRNQYVIKACSDICILAHTETNTDAVSFNIWGQTFLYNPKLK